MRFKFVKIFVCLLFLSSCGFKVADYNLDYKIKELNTSGDKKINYILKNTELTKEYFYNGEIVVHRGRNHGTHIKIEALKQRNNYYITNFDILGIVINDKINKLER